MIELMLAIIFLGLSWIFFILAKYEKQDEAE